MPYYPIFLDLRDKPVLVVGAGNVALRKAKGLLEAGARVRAVAPAGVPEFEKLPVNWLRRKFRVADLKGVCLVFTATDDREVNAAVARAAKRLGIPVNVADAPGECDFFVPARIRRGDLQIAISTSGRSPRIAAGLRRQIERQVGKWASGQVVK
jgi:siroheme synthase-like protein